MSVEGDIGALRAKVERLETEVDHLELENREIRALINKGRGAAKVIVILGGFVGALIAFWKDVKGFLT